MEKEKLLNIIENAKDKSNKDLLDAEGFLFEEHEKTKELIIELTRHLDGIADLHSKVVEEIENRKVI
jgi:hypothetical protein